MLFISHPHWEGMVTEDFICLVLVQLLAERFVLTFEILDNVTLACNSLLLLRNTFFQFLDMTTCNIVIHLLELFLQKEAIIHRGMSA